MIRKKNKDQIQTLREAGVVLAKILDELCEASKPGVTTLDLNDLAIELAKKYKVETILLGYKPGFGSRPYPAAICTSVNNVVQHGIPNEKPLTLKNGDVINLDMSIGYKGMVVDSGRTVGVGKIDKAAQKLLQVTREALYVGIEAAQVGARVGDIGHAISKYVKPYGFGVVEVLCGHGVGFAVHEEPLIPNFGKKGTGPEIEVGMVFAIEPIVNEGTKDVTFDDAGDGYTVYTKDGKRSAHFEHTVVITENGPEPVTESPKF